MLKRLTALFGLFLLLAAPPAHAQCANWLAGPLDNGTAPTGTDNAVRVVLSWDPPDNRPEMLVVAGDFTSVQGVPANRIAMLDPGTGLWQPLGAGLDGTVYCLTIFNGELVAGGLFTHAGGADAHYIARYDGATWRPLDNGVNVEGLNGAVRALTVYNSALIAAGDFSQGGSSLVSRIASWTSDATGFQPLGVGLACHNGSCSGSVNALTQYNGALVAGGSFQYAGNNPAPYLAQWNGSAWSALPGGNLNGEVLAFQPYLGEVVIGGRFTQVQGGGTVNVNHVTRWNGSGFQTLGTGTSDDVGGLGYFNGSLIVAGGSTAGGVTVNNIASWNGSTWSALGGGLTGPCCTWAAGLYAYGGELIVGGGFANAGGQVANHLARWNGATWSSFGGGTAAYVFAMTNFYGRLVAGGSFTQSPLTGPAAQNIVGWDGTQLGAYGSGVNGTVFALKSFKYPGATGDYELIAGGTFTVAGGVAATRIARWDVDPLFGFPAPAWAPMGAGFNSAVYAIERHGSATYAGGPFTASGATVLNYVARWNETTDTWESMGGGMNGAVRALRSFGGYLYAGGDFTTAGGVSTGGLARWDGSSWSAVGGFFLGQVHTLEVHNGLLVIGGTYPGINSSPNLAYFTGTYYGTFGTGGTNGRVKAALSKGGRLYITGEFTTAGGVTAPRIAYYDGSWHDVDGGLDDLGLALGTMNGEVHVGGYFLNAGSPATASPRWARFTETGVPAFARLPGSQAVLAGSNVAFVTQPVPGYGGLTYQWSHFGVPLTDGPTGSGSTIGGATSPTLVITNASPQSDFGTYRMVMSNACGSVATNEVTLSFYGDLDAAPGAPLATVFEAIGPNPARGASSLRFSLAHEARVRAQVMDVAGRRVRLLDLGRLPAGQHVALWDARDDDGLAARAGLYFVRLEVDGRRIGTRRVAMLE